MTNEKLEMTNEEGGANEKLEMGARGDGDGGDKRKCARLLTNSCALLMLYSQISHNSKEIDFILSSSPFQSLKQKFCYTGVIIC